MVPKEIKSSPPKERSVKVAHRLLIPPKLKPKLMKKQKIQMGKTTLFFGQIRKEEAKSTRKIRGAGLLPSTAAVLLAHGRRGDDRVGWGWSWLERWMAAKPWEGRNGTTDKESNIDRMSVNSTSLNLGEGEITKAYNRRDSNPDKPSPTTPKPTRPASRQSPSTPSSRATPVFAGKKSATPKNGVSTQGDDDARSMFSVQSERPRRHSIGTSTVQDDVSLSGSPSVPSYMASTQSARAKSRLQSPTLTDEGAEAPPEKGGWSVGSVKKKLSFPAGMVPPSPLRRHSGPPKIQQAAIERNGGSSDK